MFSMFFLLFFILFYFSIFLYSTSISAYLLSQLHIYENKEII